MSKGLATRERIVDRAIRLASSEGLEGVSLGRLAEQLGMSKSGLFAHFRSREELELAVIATATARFTDVVVRPALAAPRGEPRVRALFERWLEWERHESLPGGCVFVQLGTELHERPGPPRDALVAEQTRWLAALEKAATMAIDAGHFRDDLDPALFAFQEHAILYGLYFRKRLMGDEKAEALTRAAFEELLSAARASA